MKRQKVCIIGGGLTGFITAITLSKLNLDIDIITTNNYSKAIKSSRTIAISQNNYDFLMKLNIVGFSKTIFWPCKTMKIYSKNKNENLSEILEINKSDRKVLYMANNSLLIQKMLTHIKKNKHIKLKKTEKISKLLKSNFLREVKIKNKSISKYNLIILCTGGFSNLEKDIFENQYIFRKYNETSVTAILKHNSFANNSARQIFFNDKILALLPISNTKTAIVLSIKKEKLDTYKSKKNIILKNKIKSYVKKFLENIRFISDIEFRNLYFFVRKKYFKDRVLLFGDALHTVHPLAGQGFNMVLRDLMSLEKVVKRKLSLGLDIGSSDNLIEFSDETKPRNLVYSLGIDFIKNFFGNEKKSFQKIRTTIIKEMNKNNIAKNIFYNFADEGFKF